MQSIPEFSDLPLIEQVQERIFSNAAARYGSVSRFINAEPEAHDRAFELAVKQVLGGMEQ